MPSDSHRSIDRFSKLVVNGETEAKEWTSIRMTKNYQDDHGVTDVSGQDIRCFQMRAGTGTATVAAGATLGFVADQGITHPGPVQFYMAAVPEGRDINTYEAAGNVWFKVASIDGTPDGSGFTWPTYSTYLARPSVSSSSIYLFFNLGITDTRTKTRRRRALPCPRTFRVGTTSYESKASRCIRPRIQAVPSST